MEIKRGKLSTVNNNGDPDFRECVYAETGETKFAVSKSAIHSDRIAIKIVSESVKMPWLSMRREEVLAFMKIMTIGLQEMVEE